MSTTGRPKGSHSDSSRHLDNWAAAFDLLEETVPEELEDWVRSVRASMQPPNENGNDRSTSMNQQITERHDTDQDGNPAGGHSSGTGIEIEWQNGPLGRGAERLEPNGAFVEGVIRAALGRIQHYQSLKFACRENALAITKLEEALHWLNHRTADREARDVEGTHAA